MACIVLATCRTGIYFRTGPISARHLSYTNSSAYLSPEPCVKLVVSRIGLDVQMTPGRNGRVVEPQNESFALGLAKECKWCLEELSAAMMSPEKCQLTIIG